MSIKSPDDPRVRRTRKLLQQSLNALLAEKEWNDISVQDIAVRAEVNRATFYAHFEDKYALLSYSIQEQFRDALNRRSAHWVTFSPENVRLLILVAYEFLSAFVGHCVPGKAQNMEEQSAIFISLQTQFYDRVLIWLTSTARVEKKPEVTAMAVSWAIFGTVLQWTRSERRLDANTAADEILARVLPMLAPYLSEAGVR
ncbi:MAG: TetR family transcriptional regulator [Anaerolineae bacterium]|nr:TetR family transcriptional regulator [Anaerolineae bacterium]